MPINNGATAWNRHIRPRSDTLPHDGKGFTSRAEVGGGKTIVANGGSTDELALRLGRAFRRVCGYLLLAPASVGLTLVLASCAPPKHSGSSSGGALPAVSGLSPSSGLISGGYHVTVTGSHLSGATQVRFGSRTGTNLTVTSDTQLTVDAPPAATARVIDVQVVTPIGASAIGAASKFTYVDIPAPPCSINWTGSANTDWANTANWDLGRLPAAADVACLPPASNAAINSDAGAVTAVRSQGTLEIRGQLTLTGTGANSSSATALTLYLGGTLGGSGDVTVTGSFQWLRGTMTGSGTTRTASTASTVFSADPGYLTGGRTFVNDGSLVFGAPGSAGAYYTIGLLMNQGAQVVNNGTWEFTNVGDGTFSAVVDFYNQQASDATPAFTNTGLLKHSSTTNTTIAVPFTNSGTVEITAGMLRLGGAHSGTIGDASTYTVSASAVLDFLGGRTLNAGVSIGGAGEFRVEGNVTMNVPIGLSVWEIRGTLSVQPSVTLASLVLWGSLDGPGDVAITGSLQWFRNGVMAGSGTTLMASTASTAFISDYGNLAGGRTFVNDGSLVFGVPGSPSSTYETGLAMSQGARVVNNGTWEFANVRDSQFSAAVFRYSPHAPDAIPAFTNTGLLKSSTANTTTTIGVPFTNSGTVEVESGTLSVYGATIGTVSDTGSYSVASGAALVFGSGDRTLSFGSVIAPAASLTRPGPLWLASARASATAATCGISGEGDLRIGRGFHNNGCVIGVATMSLYSPDLIIRGPNEGSDYSPLSTTGVAQFGSGVNVTVGFENHYCPAVGSTFVLLRYGALVGFVPGYQVQGAEADLVVTDQHNRLEARVTATHCDVDPPSLNTAEGAGLAILDADYNDRMLERRINIYASDAGVGIHHFEYKWIGGDRRDAATPPPESRGGGQIYPEYMHLSYRDFDPDSIMTLFVQAVDRKGNASGWARSVLRTPVKPRLIALGDSITSGHHSQNGTRVCNDKNYGYPAKYFQRLQQQLPAQWQSSGDAEYHNFALSGANSALVLNDGVLNNNDSPGCPWSPRSELSHAADLLTAPTHRWETSWNTVVMTLGANDSNWSDTKTGPITPFVTMSVIDGLYYGSDVYGSSSSDCWKVSKETWNGWLQPFHDALVSNQAQIYSRLTGMDPAIHIIRIGNYDISKTGPLKLDGSRACGDTISRMTDRVVSVSFETTNSNLTQVDVRRVLDKRDDLIQRSDPGNLDPYNLLFHRDDYDKTGSWPHPNSDGAQAIANAIPLR